MSDPLALVVLFATCIIRLRDRFPFSVTSWIRTYLHNIEVGGASESKHLWGLAVDVIPDRGVNRCAFLMEIQKMGLFAVVEDGWIHIQALRTGVKPEPSPFTSLMTSLPPDGGSASGEVAKGYAEGVVSRLSPEAMGGTSSTPERPAGASDPVRKV